MANSLILKELAEKLNLSINAFESQIGAKTSTISVAVRRNSKIKEETIEKILKTFPQVNKVWLETGEGDMFLAGDHTPRKTTGEDIRKKKAFEQTEDSGLIYVPIAAQMGYARAYADPVYISHLERLYIPGLPYRGDKYRYFEGEGDSMEPTIIEGMQVIGEHIEQQDWKHAHNYYIHVIITSNRILIKRIFKKDASTWVLISDNEDYPQELLKVEEIKELWYVKRILDWRMPPPKTIEIKV